MNRSYLECERRSDGVVVLTGYTGQAFNCNPSPELLLEREGKVYLQVEVVSNDPLYTLVKLPIVLGRSADLLKARPSSVVVLAVESEPEPERLPTSVRMPVVRSPRRRRVSDEDGKMTE